MPAGGRAGRLEWEVLREEPGPGQSGTQEVSPAAPCGNLPLVP